MKERYIVCISAASWILIAAILAYFWHFPTIISPMHSDILLVAIVLLLMLALIAGAFTVQNLKETMYFLPQCLLISVIARSVGFLRQPYPPLWDPYSFLIAFLNIHESGSLEPVYTEWLPAIGGLLKWPLMLLITEGITDISGASVQWIFRYQQPLLGALFFLGIYILTYRISKNYGIALVSGLFSSLSAHIIFYQSEYHYQGLAFTGLAFLLFAVVMTEKHPDSLAYKAIAVIFCFFCILSHYFSSLLVAVLLLFYLIVTQLILVREEASRRSAFAILEDYRPNYAIYLLVIFSAMIYHLLIYPVHMHDYIGSMTSADPYQAPVISVGGSIPFPTNIIQNIRVIVLLLGLISILYTLRSKKTGEYTLAVMCLFLVLSGVFGNVLFYLEVGRLVAFYEVLIGFFVALTLFRFRDIWFGLVSRKGKTVLACVVAASIITITFFGGYYIPAFYFKSLEQNDYYWCSNEIPMMATYPYAGEWLNDNTAQNSTFITDGGRYGFTNAMVFFWGEIPCENIYGLEEVTDSELQELYTQIPAGKPAYVTLNPPHKYPHINRFLNSTNNIYTCGEISVYGGI